MLEKQNKITLANNDNRYTSLYKKMYTILKLEQTNQLKFIVITLKFR